MVRSVRVGLALALAGLAVLGGVAMAQEARREGPGPEPMAPGAGARHRRLAEGEMEGPGMPGMAGMPGMPAGPGGPGMGGGERGMGPGRMEHGFGPPPHGLRGPGPEDFERLDLTDAQRTKLAARRDDGLRRIIRLDADLQIAELDLLALVRGEHPSLQAVEAQIDRVAGLRAALEKVRVGGMLAARSLLTPEQRAKLRPPDGPGGHAGPPPARSPRP